MFGEYANPPAKGAKGTVNELPADWTPRSPQRAPLGLGHLCTLTRARRPIHVSPSSANACVPGVESYRTSH